MKKIKTVGVIGAGTMGSALAQKFAQEGFNVILVDRAINLIEKGLGLIKRSLEEALDKNIIKPEDLKVYVSNIKGSDDLSNLKSCDIIIEAIYENFDAKTELFKKLSSIVSSETILATNTSSFSITELSASVKNPERFIGLHYFYHAAKNRLVEIIPGEKTSEETVKTAYQFAVISGKDAIFSKDAYGFVVNRFFVPWLNEAVRLYEKNVATIERIEHVCKETFGIGMGPFELMNVTGVPVAYHAEKTLEIFGNLYKVSDALKKKAEEKQLWEGENPGELHISVTHPLVIQEIKERMLGLIFFICTQILDEEICTASDIEKGAKIGLKWKKGPIELMREAGEIKVARLISKIAVTYKMEMPKSIGAKFWKQNNVKLEIKGSNALITIDQPENLNALNELTMQQLAECFDKADNSKAIENIFITGSGKAFVAGADIKFFVNNIRKEKICDIESFTESGQKVFERIDNSKKKVIAVINGLALGGGLELALCADIILAVPKAQMAFPETGIGIYPGLGGTQRSAKRIGKGLSKYLIFTGKMLSAKDAEEIGLVDKVIGFEEMFCLITGEKSLPEIHERAIGEKWIALENFFEENTLQNILNKEYSYRGITGEDARNLVKTIGFKAPVALKLANHLIDDAKGCASELSHLRDIFSTSDALLGLTSIGKKVVYLGK